MTIIQEIATEMISSGKKEIPIDHIKHSLKSEGIRWSKKVESEILEELNKKRIVTLETYQTHIVNKEQKGNNKYFKLGLNS